MCQTALVPGIGSQLPPMKYFILKKVFARAIADGSKTQEARRADARGVPEVRMNDEICFHCYSMSDRVTCKVTALEHYFSLEKMCQSCEGLIPGSTYEERMAARLQTNIRFVLLFFVAVKV